MLLGRKRCCCGTECTYFHAVASSPGDGQVTFQDALDGDLIVDTSGTWTIDGSGRLKVTGPGAIRIDVPQPDSAARQRLEFFGNLANTTNDDDTIVRLSVDYIDDSNRHYAEGKAYVPGFGGSSTPLGKIVRVESGSDTTLYDETAQGFSIDFREVDAFAVEHLAGAICIQNDSVAVGAGSGASPIVVRSPAVPSAGPVGGYKAAIEIEQDGGNVFTFDQIILKRTGTPVCPPQECLSCFAAPGCQKAPAQVLATITGIVDGSGWTAGADDFNGSFTLDLVRTFRADPGATFGCSEVAGYASASFALSSTITLSGVDYYYGRIYLIPQAGESGCVTKFNLYIQVSDFATAYCTNPGVTHVRQIGVLEPTDGTDVGFDCTSLDEAEFSGGTYTTEPLDLSGASFTVSAV